MFAALVLLLLQPVSDATPAPLAEAACPEFRVLSASPREGVLSFALAPEVARATYTWVVSAGTIAKGQGTAKIEVSAAAGEFVTATVEVASPDLPADCIGFASATDELPAPE